MITGASYFGNRMLKYYLQDLKDLKAHHCNSILHCFSENDYFFYKDSMKEFVHASHEEGLEVYVDPWGVGGVFGGEADWRWLNKNLDATQVRKDGKLLGIACPNQPKFRAFLKEWAAAAIEIGGDVLFWDEPHFYLPGWNGEPAEMWGCRCPVCQDLFQQQFGHAMPTEKTDEVLRFQEVQLYDFLQDMCKTVKAINPKVRNCICLLPYRDTVKAWGKFTSMPELDIIGTDPYWAWGGDPGEMVQYFSQRIMDCAKEFKKEGQIWIQAFRIPEGKEQDVATAIDVAYDCGIRNLYAWAFPACGHMSHLRCGDSQKVWDLIGQKYGEKQNLVR